MTAPAGRSDHDPQAAADPAAALGDVWNALDALPRLATPPSVTATTIEMVAVSAQHRAVLSARPTPLAWLGAVSLVITGFIGGCLAGRATLPTPFGHFPPPFPAGPREPLRPDERPRPPFREFSERGPQTRREPPPPAETPQPPR
jgi:hypothetical protein